MHMIEPQGVLYVHYSGVIYGTESDAVSRVLDRATDRKGLRAITDFADVEAVEMDEVDLRLTALERRSRLASLSHAGRVEAAFISVGPDVRPALDTWLSVLRSAGAPRLEVLEDLPAAIAWLGVAPFSRAQALATPALGRSDLG